MGSEDLFFINSSSIFLKSMVLQEPHPDVHLFLRWAFLQKILTKYKMAKQKIMNIKTS